MGLDICVMTRIQHYSVVHSIFTALKILCALLIYFLKEETVISHTNHGFEDRGFKITKVHICKTNMINLSSFKMCDFFQPLPEIAKEKQK